MAQALDIKTGSSTAKLVLLKLCDNANDKGECWPSQELIAEQCEMTKRTVISCIKKLEIMGLLETEKKYKNANKYMLNLNSANISLVKMLHPSSENASPLSSETVSPPYIEPISMNLSENLSIDNLGIFGVFRKAYQGSKRGNETEFENFKKKTKDWREVLPDLTALLKCQENQRDCLAAASQFVPPWKNLQTWINNRCWEEEYSVTASSSNSNFKTWGK
jgi:DNA-binding Lrp family transcriptional regulator